MKLVLASKSPRRSEILKNAGIGFTVRVADADETIPDGTKPEDAVVFLAARKALAVERAEDETVLGADTIVVLDDNFNRHPLRIHYFDIETEISEQFEAPRDAHS